MNKKLLVSLLSIGLSSSALFADCNDCYQPIERGPKNCFSLYAAAGGSFTRCADICVDVSTGSYWPNVSEGYDSDLGRTGFLEYGIGYEWCDWFSLMATGQFRDTMNYAHYQTGIPVFDEVTCTFPPPTLVCTENTITDTGCRVFELDASTFMFSAILDLTNYFGYDEWWFGVQIGGGVGFTHFTVQNFHLELESEVVSLFFPDEDITVTSPKRIRDAMLSTSNNAFSAQAFIGLEYTACNWMHIGAGYRFFHGGKFCTNDFVMFSRGASARDITHRVDPWQGRLQANEIYLNVYCSY
jgi:opacity protein-like surface antigen